MKKEYHILSLSGGKDSTALAFFMRENMPESDTENEIPETYDYLDKIEIFLNKQITKLKPEKSFDHLYDTRRFLPSIVNRWCTVDLKIRVYEKYIKSKYLEKNKDVIIYTYVGIRSDELGRGINNANGQIIIKYPFQEFCINRNDVFKILYNVGINLPDYYKWRKRSGCYFCFYQSPNDWLNLYENHPDLFFKAMEYEKFNDKKTKIYGWNISMPLKEMILPENMKRIRANYAKIKNETESHKSISLINQL